MSLSLIPQTKRSSSVAILSMIVAATLGIFAGVAGYTFSYAKGTSYFSTDPKACANCHIMQRQYDSWQQASHHTSAVCTDCHLPDSFFAKYYAKSENGWRHSKLFTTGGFKEPIEIAPEGRRILEQNCQRCHSDLTHEMRNVGHASASDDSGPSCTHCHATVGHGARAALGGPLTEAELKLSPRTQND